jgi:hypothetical protein
MLNQQTRISILEAADVADPDDLEVRTLLIAALRESCVDFNVTRSGSARASVRELSLLAPAEFAVPRSIIS